MPKQFVSVRLSPHLFDPDSDAGKKLARIAELTGLDYYSAMGRWHKWLSYRFARKMEGLTPENVDASDIHITAADLDALVGHLGFASALLEVGWIDRSPDGWIICSQAAQSYYAIQQKAAAEKSGKKSARRAEDAANNTPEKKAERAKAKAERKAAYDARKATGAPAAKPPLTLADVRRAGAASN